MTDAQLVYRDSELVIGLVAAVGTDLDRVATWLTERLQRFHYTAQPIRLSDFARSGVVSGVQHVAEYSRIDGSMTACNQLRRRAGRADVLALHAANEIYNGRDVSPSQQVLPRPRTAYVLRSLKRPEEVAALRRIYGPGFFLMAVSSSATSRVDYLTNDKGMKPAEANALLERDEAEESDPFGQRTGDTYHLADVFVDAKEDVWRFLDLVFGQPFHTPTRREYAMFLAFAASVRSADLSRQVGAVIVSSSGEVVATGANDVPAKGGGSYWPDENDRRDHVLGFDPNEARRRALIVDVAKRLRPELANQSVDDIFTAAKPLLRGSPVLDITEYHRAVHAEMDALLTCARTGQSVVDATLFTTTYPCHNCAKHIVAAGIAEVVFVEPYAKSLAEALHGDAIARTSSGDEPHGKVPFVPFVGVGARRFIDLFSMTLGPGDKRVRKDDAGSVARFDMERASLRVPMMPTSYLDREAIAATMLSTLTKQETAT